MYNFKELNYRVSLWAKDKGILSKGNPIAQCDKTFEEVTELRDSLLMQKNNLEKHFNSKGVFVSTSDEIKDAIGDVLVTLLIQCDMQNLDALDCLNSALNVIEKRTGKMINGQFVKEQKK